MIRRPPRPPLFPSPPLSRPHPSCQRTSPQNPASYDSSPRPSPDTPTRLRCLQPLKFRVLLGPAQVEAVAPAWIRVGVDHPAVLGVFLEPVGWPRRQVLLPFARIRRSHLKSGRGQ